MQSKKLDQDVKATAAPSGSHLPNPSVSSHHETKDFKSTEQNKDSTSSHKVQNTTTIVKPSKESSVTGDQTCAKMSETEAKTDVVSKKSPAVENTCKADVIDASKFEKKTATTFAAKLLEAACIHSESTCERVDGRAAVVSERDLDVSNESLGIEVHVEKTDENEYVEIEKAVEEAIEEELMAEKTGECEGTADGIDKVNKADPTVDKDDVSEASWGNSESSWCTISTDESPRRLSKLEMVDKYVDQVIAKEMMTVKDSTSKTVQSSISKGLESGSNTGADAGAVASGMCSSDGEGTQSAKKKVRCAAVFNVACETEKEAKTDEETKKSVIDSSGNGDGAVSVDVEKTPSDKIPSEKELLNADCDGSIGRSNVEVEGPIKVDVSVKEVGNKVTNVCDSSDPKTQEKSSTDSTPDTQGKVEKKLGLENTVEEKPDADEEKTTDDVTQDGETVEKPGSDEDMIRKPDGDKETGLKSESTMKAVVKSQTGETLASQGDSASVDISTDIKTESGEQDVKTEGDENHKDSVTGVDSISTEITATKSVQDNPQIADQVEEVATEITSCTTQDTSKEVPKSPVHEEMIMQCQVAEVDVKEYLANAEAKHAHSTISVGVNTDHVKTVHKGIVTSKVPKMSRVTNTVAVNMVTRCVGTFEDFEKTYYEKNIELVSGCTFI